MAQRIPRTRLLYTLCLTVAGISLGFYLSKLLWRLPELQDQDVKWQLYGDPEGHWSTRSNEQRQLPSQLKRSPGRVGVAKELQEGLQKLQLSCHPGEEGILQRKYRRFLQSLDEYAVFHREAGEKEGLRTLMWMCDVYQYCGGLADRLKGITFSLLVAMFTRRKLLLSWGSSLFGEQSFLKPNMIDWFVPAEKIEKTVFYDLTYTYEFESDNYKGYEDMQQVFFLHLYSVLGGIGVDKSVEELDWSLGVLDGKLSALALTTNLQPSDLKNRTKNAGQQWIIRGLGKHGLAHLSSQEINDLVGIVFRYLFQLTDDLIANVDSAHRVLGLGHQKYVGVHIRTGLAGSPLQETVKHPKLLKQKKDWVNILKCAVDISTNHLGPSSVIFLATDSTLVKRIAVDKYGGQIRTLDNTVAHLDRMDKFPHTPYKNESEGTLASWVDFILLAESYLQVRTNSGFPAVAGQLCMLPPSRVIHGLHCVAEP